MNNCPKCNVSFIGEEIPEKDREYYSPPYHWKREIGIDGGFIGIYDGTVAYKCPDCKHEFPCSSSSWALEIFEEYQKVCRGEKIEEFDPFKIPRIK